MNADIDAVIQCTHKQAAEWCHEYIGVEHLLCGILRAEKGEGLRILSDLGVTLDRVRNEAAKLIVCANVQNERNQK